MTLRILTLSGANFVQRLNMAKELELAEFFTQMFHTQWQTIFLISPSDGHSLCVFQVTYIDNKCFILFFFSLIRIVIKCKSICRRIFCLAIIRPNHFVKSSVSNFNHTLYFYRCSDTIIHCVVHVQMS